MESFVVFGAGMVGSVIAWDLLTAGYQVLIVDRDEGALRAAREKYRLQTAVADLSDPAQVHKFAAEADFAVGALPSHLGLGAMRAVIEAGCSYVDISFLPEDPRSLNDLARDNDVTVIYDAGVAPGMSNLLAGRALAGLERCDLLNIYVGGLPVVRTKPWEYKAPFSPSDVLEEYTRPARYVMAGRPRVGEALSQVEPFEVPGLGTLEAFLTDGLRSLADLPIPNMVEKTLRYPGHVGLLKTLRAAGLFGTEPIDIRGTSVVPREVFSKLVFPQWAFDDEEEDITVMRVEAVGVRDGRSVRWRWDLEDRYDAETGIRSMSRTTAYPAAILADFLATGQIDRPGVFAPEALGTDADLVSAILDANAYRGVYYTFSEEPL
jgi:saccharopine dehydrogenase-like NADP-dependent oxidoreductase